MTPVALHHILLKSPLLADDLVKELELGADFADLAREYSACPSASTEGFAGYHDLDTLPTSLVKALSDYDGNERYTQPVKTHLGLHILKPVAKLQRPVLTDDFGEDDLKQEGRDSSQPVAIETKKTGTETHEQEGPQVSEGNIDLGGTNPFTDDFPKNE